MSNSNHFYTFPKIFIKEIVKKLKLTYPIHHIQEYVKLIGKLRERFNFDEKDSNKIAQDILYYLNELYI